MFAMLGRGLNSMLTPFAAAGNYWPSSSSPVPDTTSPVTGRAIRPLPKRRLRDRLSSEQADTIQLPPHPPSSSPIFGYPYSTGEREHADHRPLRASSGASIEAACECGAEHHREEFSEDDGEDDRQRAMEMTRRDGDFLGSGLAASRQENWESKHAAPESTSSHEDREYDDQFERTANKKKRKIPQSNAHHSTLSSDMANMGIAQRGDAMDGHGEFAPHMDTGASYEKNGASTPSPTGSGAASGRSKYGRSGRGSLDRRPLGASTNGLNAGSKGRAHPVSVKMGTSPVEPGIISAAIANAQQTPTTPTKGQENISLLQQHTKSPQSTSDFTFTPEGDNRPVWPVHQMPGAFESSPQSLRQGEGPGYRRNGVPQGTQTSPNMNGGTHPIQNPNQTQGQASAGAQPPPPPLSPKSKKKRRNRALQMAARKRKVQQEYKNYHNPPQRGEITICEFCEYEAIFGTPPVALIRQYEIKDRKERKRLAERQRLLEKAKMKGRKGKKGSNKKNNHANNQATNAHHTQPAAPANHHQNDPIIDDQLGEEEYYEDDDYEYQDPPLDPPPTPHPDARYPYAGADPGYKSGQSGHAYDDAEFDELPPLVQ
ncbi:hypothetical protein FKW77_008057 [Venturia effusa]|uniref:Uncharacterized protein n=1 Tax=Venturia effusa TaxID=50376 RepID=A0A517L1S0_9PEZI|nr:hypothetical protein FKW77_008057 [Venturia effusa]